MANFVPTANTRGIFSVGPGEYALIGQNIEVSNVNVGQVALGRQRRQSMISNEGSVLRYITIEFGNGSVVYNHAGGSIRGSEIAIVVGGGGGIVDNAGTVFGAGIAIRTMSGGGTS